MGAPLQFNLQQQTEVLKYLKIQESTLPTKMLDDPSDDVPERSWEELLECHWHEDSLKSIKTVRFMKDFERYRARPDMKTSNKSFIRTMDVFRKMGIKNCAFHLQLNNPALVGVDPRSPDLTDDQRLMIMQEMKDNFWYFLREVCHLNGGIRFRANRANISFAWCWLNHLTTMLILPRQQGKMLSKDSKVLTTKGWKRNGDLTTNDVLIMPDGGQAKVKGVYPQPKQGLYWVTFEDGRKVKAGLDHLWKLFDSEERSWEVMTTKAVMAGMFKGTRYHAPLVKPDLRRDIRLPVDPWLTGMILAAGGITFGLMHIGRGEAGIRSKVARLVEEHRGPIMVGKTIPEVYFHASHQQRLQLVQGLMDVKGSVSDSGSILWCGPDERLTKQVQELVRSLGAIAEIVDEEGRYLEIRYHSPEELFGSEIKRSDVRSVKCNEFVNSALEIKSVEYAGEEEALCIEVDHPEHLYICDDYIVTHNTVTAQCIFFWLTYISGRAYESHLITLKDDNRQQFVDAIKGIRNNIPAWMTNVTYRDKDAGNSLTYSAFGDEVKNKLTISVPQIGQEAARNVGRGLTIKSRFIDEPAYIKWMEEILNGAGPSTLTARENARRLHEPYATGFITTPASILTESGEYMYNILMESTEWRENYFDTYGETHLYDVLLKNSPKATTAPSVGMVFNYLQLGKNRDWVKKTIDELKLSLSEAKIDLLLMWDDNGKGKLFDDETRDALNEAKRGRAWSQQINDTSLYFDWFISQEEHTAIMSGESSKWFLIGLDTSGAVGRDACTIVVRDIRDGSVAGVGRYQRAFLTEVGTVVSTLLMELPNSVLIPERNYAHHMLDQLLQTLPAMGLDPFKKIFNRIFQDPVKYQNQYREVKARAFGNRTDAFYLKYKEYFGFNTNARSRETLYGFLEEAVAMTGSETRYTKLIDELTNLKLKNGRIDHEDGAHDDIVISWLLTFWYIKLGENKNEYGIPSGIALSDAKQLVLGNVKKELSDPIQQKRTAFYKQKIEEVSNMLMNCDDPLIAARLEVALDRLHAMIPNEQRKNVTIDDIKRRAQEERNKRTIELKRQRYRGR